MKLESFSPSPSAPCSLPSSSGISSLRLATDSGKEKLLLPFGRLARAIKPSVSGLPRTSKGGNNLGGGKLGKRFGEGHGQTISEKEMSAMQKINLAKCPQCRQSMRMSNTKTQYRVAFMSWDNVNGNCVQKEFSTQWYDSIDQCDKWMHEIGARIVTREYEMPSPPKWVLA